MMRQAPDFGRQPDMLVFAVLDSVAFSPVRPRRIGNLDGDMPQTRNMVHGWSTSWICK
jgi:hypothetical protein